MQNAPEPAVKIRRERRLEQKQQLRREIRAWIRELAMVIIIVLLVKNFLFAITTVSGDSMLETLKTGDRMYVSLLTPRMFGYERGDIVTCRYPGREDQCVKRIVGLPGEQLEIREGVVYIDGEAIEEDYLEYTSVYSYPAITLSEDEYFVLGDNRPVSHDSHSSDVGPVTDLVGEVRCIIWPLDRLGSVR